MTLPSEMIGCARNIVVNATARVPSKFSVTSKEDSLAYPEDKMCLCHRYDYSYFAKIEPATRKMGNSHAYFLPHFFVTSFFAFVFTF